MQTRCLGLIPCQSRCSRDKSRWRDTIPCGTVTGIDIHSISVRIVKTKFARTDVPESTSARVLESLKSHFSLAYSKPPKKGSGPKSAQRDEVEDAALNDGQLTFGATRPGAIVLHAIDAPWMREDAQEGVFLVRLARLPETTVGGPRNGFKPEVVHE